MKSRNAFFATLATLFMPAVFAATTPDNPPGPAGGPGTNWENPPGPKGGPGASPDKPLGNPFPDLRLGSIFEADSSQYQLVEKCS